MNSLELQYRFHVMLIGGVDEKVDLLCSFTFLPRSVRLSGGEQPPVSVLQTLLAPDPNFFNQSTHCDGLYPCSTKTREVLGNPSRRPKDFPRPERFPEGEARGKSRGSVDREGLTVLKSILPC